jgi:hypothetical protein
MKIDRTFVAILLAASMATGLAAGECSTTAYAAVPDGAWDVHGIGDGAGYGTRTCGDWSVRLNVTQGRLTGMVVVSRGSPILENLVLQPDGSFSGNTAAGGGTNPKYELFEYRVSGKFSGDTVSLTMENARALCPRSGQATGWR